MNEDSTQNLSSSHDETLRQILAAVTDLQVSVKDLQARVESLQDEVAQTHPHFKRQFSILNDTFLEVRADYKDLDRRVFQIEEPQS